MSLFTDNTSIAITDQAAQMNLWRWSGLWHYWEIKWWDFTALSGGWMELVRGRGRWWCRRQVGKKEAEVGNTMARSSWSCSCIGRWFAWHRRRECLNWAPQKSQCCSHLKSETMWRNLFWHQRRNNSYNQRLIMKKTFPLLFPCL